MTSTWEAFLRSPAISYPQHTPENNYWIPELLEKWQEIHQCNDAKEKVASISYGSLLLLASYTSNILHKQLFQDNDNTSEKHNIRIGLAIPEGPFLPLFVLVVHALNVSGSKSFHSDSMRDKRDVVLIPMETDEAPERLRHILADSDPDLILVAPGKDTESLVTIMNEDSSTQLVDYTDLVRNALALIDQADGSLEIFESLYPSSVRDSMIDSIRCSHAFGGDCWDVARLVAWGCLLLESYAEESGNVQYQLVPSPGSCLDVSTIDRDIMSHIVYTSGTTGESYFSANLQSCYTTGSLPSCMSIQANPKGVYHHFNHFSIISEPKI
jgi:hypothetical protein